MHDFAVLASGWCERGWPLLLVFTVSVLVVAALRMPCRRGFGAGRACLLWLLPPAALLASLLPHARFATTSLPPIVLNIAALPGIASPAVTGAAASDWRAWIALSWLAGVLATVSLMMRAQSRYRARLHSGEPYAGATSRWPILRAADLHTGPALVGAWRPCIVVPSDFDVRYDAGERKLILAHEAMHARRRDGWWCLLAQIVMAAFWFHPLAWWALSAFRRDQELACDAAVLRECRGLRRRYADAMLKTLSAALPLPVGCAWSPRHPITERIAMLKHPQPSRVRRAGGVALSMIVIVLGAGGAYAATAPASTANMHPNRYTLKLVAAINGQSPKLHATTCLRLGESYKLVNGVDHDLPPWHGRFSVVPASQGLLEVRAELSGGTLKQPVFPHVRTRPGQMATIMLGERPAQEQAGSSSEHTLRIDLTPSVGC